MSSAYRYLPKYTVEDYRQWEGDWELWQGIPVSMTPSPFGRHQRVAMRLATTLQNAIDATRCDAVVLYEIDWIVSDDTVVRPDLVVLCGDVPPGHVENAPAVIAEVLSPSTQQRDRSAKFDLYQDERVMYYLMLDPDENTLNVYALDDGNYREQVIDDEIVLDICDGCNLKFPIANLFS